MRAQFGFGAVILVVAILTTLPAATAAPPTCGGRTATLVLTGNEDVALGTAGDDVIVGTSGTDIIVAGDGNDLVCSLGGPDEVSGGRGNDMVDAGVGGDVVMAAAFQDNLAAGEQDGDDVYKGGAGSDWLSMEALRVPVQLDASTNGLTGSGADRMNGFQSYRGGAGNDVFIGTEGTDKFDGYRGQETVSTFGGRDIVYADGDVSTGAGNDSVHHLSLNGTVRLGAGDDFCNCNGRVFGDAGRDEFESAPERPARIDGGAGSDVLHLKGDDQDTAVNNVVVDVEAGTIRLVGQTDPTSFRFLRIHTVTTGRGDDVLLGSAGRDVLNGGRGDDILRGRGGNDRLSGHRDQDVAYGGPGRDTCLVERASGCESRR